MSRIIESDTHRLRPPDELEREREDAMDFFRSDAFRETVEWGREVLADRPRHVFLA